MSRKIQIKRGLKADLPTLNLGEFGLCTDTGELFVGASSGNLLINVSVEDGDSAFEIASKNGFNGTEIEWLESLKGDKGDKGEDGQDGVIPTETISQIQSVAQEINNAKTGFPTLSDKLNSIIIFEDLVAGESFTLKGVDTTAPTLTVTEGGAFTGTKSITMSVNETATIYYTLNGSNPTVNSSIYSSPLSISTTTTLKAFAKDTAGNSSPIQTITYTLTDTTAPNNVTNLTVGSIGSTGLVLTWTPSTSSDVAGYEVYNGTSLLTTVTSNNYTVSGLTAGTQYTFTVKAKDTSNNVASGTSVTASTIALDTTPPDNVTNLVATNNTTGTSLTLTWTPSSSSDVGGYEIHRNGTLMTTITGTSYNATGLTANTQYTFMVKAKDTSGNIASGTSVTVTATYVDNVAPVLTITAGGTFTDTKTVTMSTNETATIYYTLDNSIPSETSLVYSTPIVLNETTTIKAFAKDTVGNTSVVQDATFTKVTAQDFVTDNLEIHYDFTTYTTTPPIATDLSGNENNGELRGYEATATSGINNGELVGDGRGDYIYIPRTAKLKTYPFTIELYFRATYTEEGLKTPSQLRLFDSQFDTNGTGSGVSLFINGENETTAPNTISLTGSVSQPPRLSASHDAFNNQYVHVVAVWESGKQTIYVDGVQKATQNTTSANMTESTRNLFLLKAGNSNDTVKGAIKKFRYYTKALTSTEVEQNYNQSIQ